MIKEAIDRIQELADEARSPEILELPGNKRQALLFKPDGESETIEIPPPAHNELLANPVELAKFITDQMKDGSKPPTPGGAIIFVGMFAITALYDKGDRRDKARCDLTTTPAFRLLSNFANAVVEHSQRDFIRLLRIRLAGAIPEGSRLLELVRNIKWQNGVSGGSVITNTSNTMGRQLVQEVMGVEAFPDSQTVFCPIWDRLPLRLPIQCAVEINADNNTFALTPLPGQIEDATEQAQGWLKTLVAEAIPQGIEVYIGSPRAGGKEE